MSLILTQWSLQRVGRYCQVISTSMFFKFFKISKCTEHKIKKYSNKLSMKALVEKSMLRKIMKIEEQISTLPYFTSISQGNPKKLKDTQLNSRELKGTHLNSSELI